MQLNPVQLHHLKPAQILPEQSHKNTQINIRSDISYMLLNRNKLKNVLVVLGKKCKLLHWIGSGEIVAETEIECTDPQTSVHHMVLGPDHWKIAVKKILVSKVNLYRPTSDLHKLEDARGF
ncbi:hypothetical protein ACOSQ4_032889 [Xanthoceras sorbifolium]